MNTSTAVKSRVLLVEGNNFLRHTLHDWLTQSEEMDLIGEVTNGVDAVTQALDLNPDVVLIDVSLSDMSGLVAAHLIHKLTPNTYIVLLLDQNDEAYRNAARRIGVAACVVKTAPSQELRTTLRQPTRSERR